MPSAAASAAKASCSAFNFALLVPFVAGGLESSTNQLVGVSLAAPPTDPGAPAPSPASAGATARPATQIEASTSRRLVFNISPLPFFGWCQRPAGPPSDLVAWFVISNSL